MIQFQQIWDALEAFQIILHLKIMVLLVPVVKSNKTSLNDPRIFAKSNNFFNKILDMTICFETRINVRLKKKTCFVKTTA